MHMANRHFWLQMTSILIASTEKTITCEQIISKFQSYQKEQNILLDSAA
jgi:hypothetical protein